MTVLEAGLLLWRRRADLVLTLSAGLALLTAMRLVIAAADWWWLALALLAALVAHMADLARRWHQ